MRVLLDECLPRKLRRELPGHEVRTVVEAGWSGTRNGALLRRAAGEFDVLLTVDSNMEYQQCGPCKLSAARQLCAPAPHP